jgi:voltage-gated potassium channel
VPGVLDRLQRLAIRRMQRALETGRILPYMMLAISTIVVAFGVLMRVLAPNDYPSIGIGIWWAVQTVTTVGYGDVVPSNAWGRLVASVLMVIGFATLSLLTGIVASLLVHRRTSSATESGFSRLEQRLGEVEKLLRSKPS